MINWKVRINNKAFWLMLIPALLLLAKQICALVGVTIEIEGLTAQLMEIIETLFVIAAVLGVVNDPTTAGIHDSAQAMTYETPKKSE